MTEQTEESKPEFINMVYLGNTFDGKGVKKDGNPWVKHKVSVKTAIDAQYANTWGVFVPLTAKNSLQLEALKQGETYNFMIKKQTKPNRNNQMTTFTNILWIGSKQEGKEAQVTTETATHQGNHVTNVNLDTYKDELEAFVQVYKDNFTEDKHKASHFIVQFMIQYKINVVLIEKIYDIFKEKIETK